MTAMRASPRVNTKKLRPALKRAWISPEVMGSDHCPVGLELK